MTDATAKSLFGALAAEALLESFEAAATCTSTKLVIEHLREPERAALFEELLGRATAEVEVRRPPGTRLRAVPCGRCDVLPFFVEPDTGAAAGPNRGTEGFASTLRDYFAVGCVERPRALVTLTRLGNETQRSASDPIVDRALLTLRSLARQLLARGGVTPDSPRWSPVELMLDRVPEERPWDETLGRIRDFLDATRDAPPAAVGRELPRLGVFFSDPSSDWGSGKPRFSEKLKLVASTRLEENASCFAMVDGWYDDVLEDAEAKVRATFDQRSAELLISCGGARLDQLDFSSLSPGASTVQERNGFRLDALIVSGVLTHAVERGGGDPVLLVAALPGAPFRIHLPLALPKRPIDHVHLVGWDRKGQKPRSEKGASTWSMDEGAEIVTIKASSEPFEVWQVLLTGGPRTLRHAFDTIWVAVYRTHEPRLAIETGRTLNLEHQAWEPRLDVADTAFFELWSAGDEVDRPVIEVSQGTGTSVDDVDDDALSGEEEVTSVTLEREGFELETRVFWRDRSGTDLDGSQLQGQLLEELPYQRLSLEQRRRLVAGLQSGKRGSYLHAITRLNLQGAQWQVTLGDEARVMVASHDAHGEETAVGHLVSTPVALSLDRRPGPEGWQLAARAWPDQIAAGLRPYLEARADLFASLQRAARARLRKKPGAAPLPLRLIDLAPHEARIDAYLRAWLDLLESIMGTQQPPGPLHGALLDTDTVFELDASGALQRVTVLPTHPWLMAALLRFQKTMALEMAELRPGKKPSSAGYFRLGEIESLANPVPLDEWCSDAPREELRRVDGPPFHWAFVPREAHRKREGLDYVRRVVRNRLRRYVQMHRHLADSRRTIRIGFVNPGDGRHLLDGIREWMQMDDQIRHPEVIPNVEVLMFHEASQAGEEVGKVFDDLFQQKHRSVEEGAADEVLLQKLHYMKRCRPFPEQAEDYVHLCFVHHLLSEKDYQPREQKIAEGWDGCFGDGVLATPLRHTSMDRHSAVQKLRSAHGLWIGDGSEPLRRGLSLLLALVRGRSQGMIQPGYSLYPTVELPTLKQMRPMYDWSDWVVHLDRELSLDLFEVFGDPASEDTLTVIEYSDQEDPQTPGYDTITVTRNARPYVEQLTSVLERTGLSVSDLSSVERRRQAGLLRDINVLSGSWALDFLLGNIALPSLSNRLKGNVGSALVYRWLERVERPLLQKRFGRNIVPIYISLEELIRATPAAGLPLKDGLFQRFSNENEPGEGTDEGLRKICDDLLVLYLTPSREGRPTRIFGRVIEVKFGEGAAHAKTISAAAEQVKHTQGLLHEYMGGASEARDAVFRYKQLSMLLKTQIEQAICFRVVEDAAIKQLDLWQLSTNLASGNYSVDYAPGGYKGDAFLLSTPSTPRPAGDVDIQIKEGVRVIRMERATLEWLAFQPEDSPTLLVTPTDTALPLDRTASWVPGEYHELGASIDGAAAPVTPIASSPVPAGSREPGEPDVAEEPEGDVVVDLFIKGHVDERAEIGPSASTVTLAPEPAAEAPIAAPAHPAPSPPPAPAMTLKEAASKPVAEAPYPRERLMPVLQRLDAALEGHRIKLELPLSLDQVDLGPRLVRVYTRPQSGTTIKAVRGISEDLAREVGTLSSDVHICNVPERHAVGIDLPIDGLGYTVSYEQLEAHPSFGVARSALALGFCAGIDVTGHARWVDLADMPHMLVAGTTGSGKTVFLRSTLLTLLQHHGASDLQVRMSSSKPMDFMPFTKVPQGRSAPIAEDHESALHLVDGLVAEMDRRIKLISDSMSDNLAEYNTTVGADQRLPRIVAVIDEYSETVISFPDKAARADFENAVARLAQKARAAGIHLIICMQRPDSTVLEGRIKSNILHRFALKLPQSQDSRVILDESGAEALLGHGDLLYKNADSKLFRLQVPFLDKDVLRSRLKRLIDRG